MYKYTKKIILILSIILIPVIANAAVYFINKADLKYQGNNGRPCLIDGYTLTGTCPDNKTPYEFCPTDSSLYKECRCNTSIYQYDSNNCTDGAILSGKICDGKYESCGCPEAYQYDSTNCPKPKELGGGSCDNKYLTCLCPSSYNKSCPSPLVGVDNQGCDGLYTACKCPDKYIQCNNGGEVGAGSCSDSDGTKYTQCKSTTCKDGGFFSSNQSNKICSATTYEGLSCYDCKDKTCDAQIRLNNPEVSINGDIPGAETEVITQMQYKYIDRQDDGSIITTGIPLDNKIINSGLTYFNMDKTKYSACQYASNLVKVRYRNPVYGDNNINLDTNELNNIHLEFFIPGSDSSKNPYYAQVILNNENVWNNVEVSASTSFGDIVTYIQPKTGDSFKIDKSSNVKSTVVHIPNNSTLFVDGKSYIQSLKLAGTLRPYDMHAGDINLVKNGVINMTTYGALKVNNNLSLAKDDTGTGGIIVAAFSELTVVKTFYMYKQSNNKYPVKIYDRGFFGPQNVEHHGGSVAIGLNNTETLSSGSAYVVYGNYKIWQGDAAICIYPTKVAKGYMNFKGKITRAHDTSLMYNTYYSGGYGNLGYGDLTQNWKTTNSSTSYCSTSFPY